MIISLIYVKNHFEHFIRNTGKKNSLNFNSAMKCFVNLLRSNLFRSVCDEVAAKKFVKLI